MSVGKIKEMFPYVKWKGTIAPTPPMCADECITTIVCIAEFFTTRGPNKSLQIYNNEQMHLQKTQTTIWPSTCTSFNDSNYCNIISISGSLAYLNIQVLVMKENSQLEASNNRNWTLQQIMKREWTV